MINRMSGGIMQKTISVFVIVMLGLFSAVTAFGSIINANLYTEFNGYKVKLPQEESHIRSFQGMRLSVRDAFIPGLSVFVRGRIASDLSEKLSTDPDFRVFGAYLEYARKDLLTIKAGRQYVYAGIGGLTLDGGRVDYKLLKKLLITGYVGTTPGPSFYTYDEINTWKESNAYGGRVKYSGPHNVGIGISYQERRYKENLDSRVTGIDFAWSGRLIGTSLRADYDNFQERLKLFAFRPNIKCPLGHSLNLEYLYRQPTLGLSNLFSTFASEPYHQFRINPTYKFSPKLYAFGTWAYTKFDDDNATRFSLGGSYRGQSLGMFFSDGYGGSQLGLFGSLSRNLNEKLRVYASGNMFDYKIDTNEDDTTPSLQAFFGCNYKLTGTLGTRAEMQILSNNDYKYDTRYYVRVDYGIRFVQGDKEVGGGN